MNDDKPKPRHPAERLAVLTELMDTNVYDDDGNVIGQKEPIITFEEALAVLRES